MNVQGDTKVYCKYFDGRPSYSRRISSQEYKDGQKGDWISAYEQMQFPKGAVIKDRSIVRIKGFEAVYKTKTGEVKRKLVVQEYKVLDAPRNDDVPEGFASIAEEIPW